MSKAALVDIETNVVTSFINLNQGVEYTAPAGQKIVFTDFAAPGYIYEPSTGIFTAPPPEEEG